MYLTYVIPYVSIAMILRRFPSYLLLYFLFILTRFFMFLPWFPFHLYLVVIEQQQLRQTPTFLNISHVHCAICVVFSRQTQTQAFYCYSHYIQTYMVIHYIENNIKPMPSHKTGFSVPMNLLFKRR